MLTIAVIATAICAAIPVAIFIRMVVTRPRVRAEIHVAFQNRPTSTQGATSSAKTPVAPCNPARYYAHEVVSS